MKKITMFMFESCPHCKLARKFIAELCAEKPEYAKVPFEMIDEQKQPDLAAKFDYYYVPTFYVDGVKVHEGHAEKADVTKVFEAAMK